MSSWNEILVWKFLLNKKQSIEILIEKSYWQFSYDFQQNRPRVSINCRTLKLLLCYKPFLPTVHIYFSPHMGGSGWQHWVSPPREIIRKMARSSWQIITTVFRPYFFCFFCLCSLLFYCSIIIKNYHKSCYKIKSIYLLLILQIKFHQLCLKKISNLVDYCLWKHLLATMGKFSEITWPTDFSELKVSLCLLIIIR